MKWALLGAITICGCMTGLVHGGDPNALSDEEKQAGFQLLFNGHDLNGWRAKKGPWEVEDGAIHFEARSSLGTSLQCEKTIPEDFDLRFEWTVATHNEAIRPGQFTMGTFGADTKDGWKGRLECAYRTGDLEILLLTQEIGIPAKFNNISGTHSSRANPRRPAGQWNQSRMLCKGSAFQLWLNGKIVNEVDLCEGDWLKLDDVDGNPIVDGWLTAKKKGLTLEIQTTDGEAWYRGFKVGPFPRDASRELEKELEQAR